MKGFFSIKDCPGNTGIVEMNQKVSPLQALEPGAPFCSDCGLSRGCKSPKMSPKGDFNRRILFLGKCPDTTDDQRDYPFSGDQGTKLFNYTRRHGIDFNKDGKKLYAVSCCATNKDGEERDPSNKEIYNCKPLLLKQIETLKPQLIMGFSPQVVTSLFGGLFSNIKGITPWLGWTIPVHKWGAWVTINYDPAWALVQKEKDKHLHRAFEAYMERGFSVLDKPLPDPIDWEAETAPIYNFDEIMTLLKRILEEKPEVTLDWETNCLKPYNSGSKLETMGINALGMSFATPMRWKKHWTPEQLKEIESLTGQILSNPEILKIAHDVKFEASWAEEKLGIEARGFAHCTKNCAHLLDDRKDVTRLKFLSLLKFGIFPYDGAIKKYLESEKNEEFNTIEEAPLEPLLKYNATDCLVTKHLADSQRKEMGKIPSLRPAVELWNRGLDCMRRLQRRGIPASKKYYDDQKVMLDKRIGRLERALLRSEVVEKYIKMKGRPLNLNSSDQIAEVIYDVLGYEIKKTTSSGTRGSVDVETLTEFSHPWTDQLITMRRLGKIRDTYLAQFFRELGEDGKIHPFFNLHTARSFRSSSNNPNFQNIPIREVQAKMICRGGIRPLEGYRFCEGDFGSLEVRIIACASQDPTLVNYILDPSTDMHRDQSMKIFALDPNEVSKTLRFHAKNGQVFPMFYTSWYKSCATHLWDEVILPNTIKTNTGVPIRDHLFDEGIKDYASFEKHMRWVENDFWDRFRTVKKWQDKVIAKYLEKGYIEMFFGHRRGGYITKAECINSSIQGPAFHCLLWSACEIDERLMEGKFKTQCVAQIHDSLINHQYPDEDKRVVDIMKHVVEVELRERTSWMIVPMEFEIEFAPINGSWNEKKEVKWSESDKTFVHYKSNPDGTKTKVFLDKS